VIIIKRRDLDKIFIENGYYIEHGGNHDKYIKGSKVVPVPRHRELDDYFVKLLLKQAGIKR
jgi:mRNA interferase HicA